MSNMTTTETLALILRGGVTYLNDAALHMAADRLVSQSMRIHGLIAAIGQERQDWSIERKRLIDRITELESRLTIREVCDGRR